MVWSVDDDLDKHITIIREDYERATGERLSKKDLLKKLIYDNERTKTVLESYGIKVSKELLNLPKI